MSPNDDRPYRQTWSPLCRLDRPIAKRNGGEVFSVCFFWGSRCFLPWLSCGTRFAEKPSPLVSMSPRPRDDSVRSSLGKTDGAHAASKERVQFVSEPSPPLGAVYSPGRWCPSRSLR